MLKCFANFFPTYILDILDTFFFPLEGENRWHKNRKKSMCPPMFKVGFLEKGLSASRITTNHTHKL